MPKTVDHGLRRLDIGEALWRVVEHDGMRGVSVRVVAAEAGVSPGSLRHYFSSQAELIVFAVELMVERVSNRMTDRIRAIGDHEDPVDWLTELFKEGLPLDRPRSDEMSVWNAMVEQSRIDPALEPARLMEWSASQLLCRTAVVNLLGLTIQTSPDSPLDEALEVEATLLHAVWDGLGMHLLLQPEAVRAEVADRLLRLHLERIRTCGVSASANSVAFSCAEP